MFFQGRPDCEVSKVVACTLILSRLVLLCYDVAPSAILAESEVLTRDILPDVYRRVFIMSMGVLMALISLIMLVR